MNDDGEDNRATSNSSGKSNIVAQQPTILWQQQQQ